MEKGWTPTLILLVGTFLLSATELTAGASSEAALSFFFLPYPFFSVLPVDNTEISLRHHCQPWLLSPQRVQSSFFPLGLRKLLWIPFSTSSTWSFENLGCPDPYPVLGAFLSFFPAGAESSFAVAFAFSDSRLHLPLPLPFPEGVTPGPLSLSFSSLENSSAVRPTSLMAASKASSSFGFPPCNLTRSFRSLCRRLWTKTVC